MSEAPKFVSQCKGCLDYQNHCGECSKCKYYGWTLDMKPNYVDGNEKQSAHNLKMKYVAAITSATSLSETMVYALAENLLDISKNHNS